MNNSTVLTEPSSTDGAALFNLIQVCPPLDNNSQYCNLLQCSHFSKTSVAAKQNKQLVGFISGYLLPGNNDTLFIWQVAVDQSQRGKGLASRMLQHILSRPFCKAVRFLETSITESNHASRALFSRFAEKHETEMKSEILFGKETHFAGSHDSEILLRIGPFNAFELNN